MRNYIVQFLASGDGTPDTYTVQALSPPLAANKAREMCREEWGDGELIRLWEGVLLSENMADEVS